MRAPLKILIADASPPFLDAIIHSEEAKPYLWEVATTGSQCLEKLRSFQPHLIIAELFLPGVHAIHILQKLRGDPKTKEIGFIIFSSAAMTRNYHAALECGANYFLTKPFSHSQLFALIKRFEEGTLQPDPLSDPILFSSEKVFLPKSHPKHCYIKFWGSRGSSPVSGMEYMQFGGNTSCLEIRHGKDRVIIDAGTGIRKLGNQLMEENEADYHLFISHTHWDHLTGFPFFSPLYEKKCKITIWIPLGFEKNSRELFADLLAYAYFPVRIEDIQAKISFKELNEGTEIKIGAITISTLYTFHPGPTFCFKIQIGRHLFGYVTDNELFMGYLGHPNEIDISHPLFENHKRLIHFFQNCPLMIHEAQFTSEEYQNKIGWGHSSITNATIFLKHIQAKKWIVTHHDPGHTDEDLHKKFHLQRDILEELEIPCSVEMAFDGLVIPL